MPDDFGTWKWISEDGVEYNLSDEPDIEVIDYANIGMPPATINTTPSALSGANVNLSRINAHRIPLVLKFQGDNFVANQEKLDDLRKTLFPIGPNGPRTGYIEHTRGTGRVSRIPVISESGLQQAGEWYKGPANWVFSAIFLALRPTWRAIDYSFGIDETDLALAGGLQWPAEWPLSFPPTRIQVSAEIDNVGDAIATKVEFTLIPNEIGIKKPDHPSQRERPFRSSESAVCPEPKSPVLQHFP